MTDPTILYDTSDYLVINKPVGLTVNKSETTKEGTVQDWVENKFKVKSEKLKVNPESEFYKRSGIVHRLDKDTSGALLIAKNEKTFLFFQEQFKKRQVKKIYLALVWGKLTGSGTVTAPIARNPYNRMRFGVFLGGREAITNYKSLEVISVEKNDFSLIEVYPETGRTHQIRVHLHYVNHPIAGDILYSGRKLARLGRNLFGRLMLHAWKLVIADSEGKIHTFEAGVPQEFREQTHLWSQQE